MGYYFLNRTTTAQEKENKNLQMWLYQIKKLLHIKGKNYYNEETTHGVKEKFVSYSLNERLISKIYEVLQNLSR
jgi:hypothetical protein